MRAIGQSECWRFIPSPLLLVLKRAGHLPAEGWQNVAGVSAVKAKR